MDLLKRGGKIMNEFKFGTYCKKCFLRKYKLSKKNVDRIIYTPYIETCECCGKIEKLVDDIEEDDYE